MRLAVATVAATCLVMSAAAGKSTLEELCDCSKMVDYGFRCACGDPKTDPSINGCCNIGKGSCDDFCAGVAINTEVDQNDPVALRAEVARLKEMLKARPPPAPPAPPTPSADGLTSEQQKKAAALEAAFQTQAISLAQYEVAAAALAGEIAAATPKPAVAPNGLNEGEKDCPAALSCESCRGTIPTRRCFSVQALCGHG
jgi:hypothetical protein